MKRADHSGTVSAVASQKPLSDVTILRAKIEQKTYFMEKVQKTVSNFTFITKKLFFTLSLVRKAIVGHFLF